VHAALDAIGLLIILYTALSTGISKAALTAFVILMITAPGRFYLASMHLQPPGI
jgi:hypothetical protein